MLSWKTCLRAGVSAFVLFLCVHYWGAMSGLLLTAFRAATPVILGCVIAFILDIPMSFYERHFLPGSQKPWVNKARRPVCLLLACFSVAAIFLLLLRLVVPELITCLSLLVSQVPGTLERFGRMLAQSELATPALAEYLETLDWQQLIERTAHVLLSGFGNVANVAAGVITSVVTGTISALMAFIFAVYVLLGKERLARQFKAVGRRYVKRDWREKGRHVVDVLKDCFRCYIVGQCTEAVILGALCASGMLLFRFPYAAVVGATVGFTALIPVAGAYIGGAVGFLLILTVDPLRAVLFLLYLAILQQLEGNIIYPKVVGTSLGLPGMWVLCAVIIGGGVWGIPGMVLGVPLAAAAYRLLREDVTGTPA